MTILLASQSPARRAMLVAAGVAHEAMSPQVDEASVRDALRAEGHNARQLADALAELKALRLSRRVPCAIVLGCDQTLGLADGTMLDKPGSRDEAAAQLRQLCGRAHTLTSAVVACQNGVAIWRAVAEATLHMRAFSDTFLETYLDAEGDALFGCVGAYRLEGLGVQLFDRIAGDHFTILGLPLLPLLRWLRERGEIAA